MMPTPSQSLSSRGDFTDWWGEDRSLERSKMAQAQLIGAASSRLRALDVRIEGSDLSGSDFDESTFTRVVFHECRLSGAVFTRCSFRDVLFSGCRLNQANFAMSEASTTVFEDCDLRESDFYAASLDGTRFLDCNLSGAQFSKASTTCGALSRLDPDRAQGRTGPGRSGHRVVPGASGRPLRAVRTRYPDRRRARSAQPTPLAEADTGPGPSAGWAGFPASSASQPGPTTRVQYFEAVGGLRRARWC